MSEKINELLQKGAIQEFQKVNHQFILSVFLAP